MGDSAELDVANVATLARLHLNEAETRLFGSQLVQVLKYAEQLRDVDVSSVDAEAHEGATFNVFRDDEPQAWLTAEEALRNAPRQANGLFVVTKVIE